MNTKKKNLTKQICVLALLTAAGVVLGRLVPVVNLWNTKIEFAFVAVMLAISSGEILEIPPVEIFLP